MLNNLVKLIAHRGNLKGKIYELENSPEYIDNSIIENSMLFLMPTQ